MESIIRKIIVVMLFLGASIGGSVAGQVNISDGRKAVTKWDDSTWLRKEVKQLVLDKDFHQLEKMVIKARAEKQRYKTTAWVLHDLYNAIPYSMSNYEAIYRFTTEWRNASPKSNIPDVIEARAYVARAWAIRGNAKFKNLSSSEYIGFKEYLEKAWELFYIAENIGPVDAEICTKRTELAFLLHGDKALAQRIFGECVKIEPGYYPVYNEMLNYLQPKWFGSSKEMLRFVEESAENTKHIDGDGLYSLLVNARARNTNKLFNENGGEFSWARTKSGFHDLLTKYGESPYVLHRYGYLAMLVKDYKAFAEVLAKTGTEWDENKEKYYKKRSWYEHHLNHAKKYL